MEPKPKERIVFDEDPYYGAEGEEMAINDLMERDGLTEGEVREDFTDDEIFNHQMEMKDFDYEEEMRALAAFFNGEKSDMSDFVNPYGGNHILVPFQRPSRVLPPCGVLRYLAGCRTLPGRAVRLSLLHDRPA